MMKTCNADFFSTVSNTKHSLQQMLLGENIYSTPGLLPAIGRLGNSMVACLGPDFILGSESYEICRSIVAELRSTDATGVRLQEDILSASLESVLYAQMLILFAPNALPSEQHIEILVATLPSRHPQLRKAAAETLRHLAERDTHKVLAQHIEPHLLAALDGETDSSTVLQLQASINVLLEHGVPFEPTRWISILDEVINCATTRASDNERPRGAFEDDKEHDLIEDADQPVELKEGQNVAPRLRTKLFAARCLAKIPEIACFASDLHSDALKAATHSEGDWFVNSAALIIGTGFKMAVGSIDGLKSYGTHILLETLRKIGGSRDPLCPEDLLLFQFQAQYVSALRSSLATDASPAVHAAGCALAAEFFKKGIARGDSVVMERLLSLLCAPLALWMSGTPDQTQTSYSERVAAGARVALLESHAICAISGQRSDEKTREIVNRSQGPFYTILVECWTGLMEDTFVLFCAIDAHDSYFLRLYGRLGESKAPRMNVAINGIKGLLERAWPQILEAATFVLFKDRTVSHGEGGSSRHESLFDVTIALCHLTRSSSHEESIAKSLAWLTNKRYAKDGWLATEKLEETCSIACSILQSENTSPGLLSTMADVLSNVMHVSVVQRNMKTSRSAVTLIMSLVNDSEKTSPHATGTALGTLRNALHNSISIPASVEEIDFYLYQCIRIALNVVGSSSNEATLAEAQDHIIKLLTLIEKCCNTVGMAAGTDPDTPKVEEILDYAVEESCSIFLENADKNHRRCFHVLVIILVLGSRATNSIVADESDNPQENRETNVISSRIKCIACLDLALKSRNTELKSTAIGALHAWMETAPPTSWAKACAGIFFPYLMCETDNSDHPSDLHHLSSLLELAAFSCCLGGKFGEHAMKAFIPRLIAKTSETPSIHRKSVDILTKLATGDCEKMFKNAVSALSEDEKTSLRGLLSLSKPDTASRALLPNSKSAQSQVGLKALDLSRFK